MDLFDSQQMAGQAPIDQARTAIAFLLRQTSRENPVLGYFVNIGSQSFDLLTEALATIDGVTVREVRERFICRNAEKPIGRDAVRRAMEQVKNGKTADALDWLEIALGDDESEEQS